jgi:hypothetical protein
LDGMIARKYNLTVALPEGASGITYSFGKLRPVRHSIEKSYGYFSFVGKPTVVLEFDNFLTDFDGEETVIVEYSFST